MIYLDNAATTQVGPEAAQAAVDAMTNLYANPSSAHAFGAQAQQLLQQSRQTVAQAAGVEADTLYFTSGGTASDNLAIRGFLEAYRSRGGRIITSAYEHPAVLRCFEAEEKYFQAVYLTPNPDGIIDPDLLQQALTPDTRLVSIMHVNNETGAVNPIRQLSALTRALCPQALFHTDAIQGFLKEPFDYSCTDAASFSAHKNHAPKGIGALYVRRGVRLKPVQLGGGQEKGLFSTTSNVPGAAAWAEAIRHTDVAAAQTQVRKLYEAYVQILQRAGARILSPSNGSPYILSAAFDGYLGENMLHALAEKEIYISTGSACSSKHGSHVYQALGMQAIQKNVIRISFSSWNTLEQAQEFEQALHEVLQRLIKK